MTWRPINDSEARELVRGGQSLGGYGWDYNSFAQRWEAGHTYLMDDGRRVVIERRRERPTDQESDTTVWVFEDWE